MPRMKPIQPWHEMYKQIEMALRFHRANMTGEELERAITARNALYMLAHNREPPAAAVEALRKVLDKKRS